MLMKRIVALFFSILVLGFLFGCSGSYDSSSGMYANKGKGFSINFPAGWKKIKSQMGALISIANTDETAQISIGVQDLPENISLDQYFKKVSIQGNRMGARTQEKGDMTIAGVEARWSMLRISVAGEQFTSLNYYVMNNNRVYAIICVANSEDFSNFESTFDRAVESFNFI